MSAWSAVAKRLTLSWPVPVGTPVSNTRVRPVMAQDGKTKTGLREKDCLFERWTEPDAIFVDNSESPMQILNKPRLGQESREQIGYFCGGGVIGKA